MNPTVRPLPRLLSLLTLAALWLVPATFAAKPGKADRMADADLSDAKLSKREERANVKADRDGSASTNDAAARQLDKLRDRLGVTDDAEWSVMSERITKVEELRRGLTTGARGPLAAGDKAKRNARGDTPANPEYDALRAALGDQYTEAEIKARLARVRELYQQRQAQLTKAQAELRAILTVRQEAIMVMAGLLPP